MIIYKAIPLANDEGKHNDGTCMTKKVPHWISVADYDLVNVDDFSISSKVTCDRHEYHVLFDTSKKKSRNIVYKNVGSNGILHGSGCPRISSMLRRANRTH